MIICSIFGYLLYSTCWKIRYFYFKFVVIFNVKNILACCLQRKRCLAIDVCLFLIPDSFVKSARWQQGNGTVLPAAGRLTTEKMDQIATSCIRTHTTVWHACMDHFKEK